MRFLSSLVIGLMILLCGAALLYPTLDRIFLAPRRAFAAVIQAHQGPRHRHDLQQRDRTSFLYLSWFPTGNPKYSRYGAVYDDRMREMGRRIWDRGTAGGGSGIEDDATFQTLKNFPPLPTGLPDADAVPCARLLIVSQQQKKQWVTRYYDEDALPAPIVTLLRTTGIADQLHVRE